MKRLLSILMTLILSICLINVNTNNTKADDESKNYTFTYNSASQSNKWTCSSGGSPVTIPVNDIKAGDTITVQTAYESEQARIVFDNGSNIAVDYDEPYTYTVKYHVVINADDLTSEGNIFVFDAITTKGLKYDGDTSGSKTGWLEYDDSGTPGYKSINTTRLTDLGISMSGNTITFSKSLISYSNNNTIVLEKDADIVITNDLSITNEGAGGCVDATSSSGTQPNITIDGNSHTLITQSIGNSNNVLKFSGAATIKDITIGCSCQSSLSAIFCTNNLTLAETCTVLIGNTGTGGTLEFGDSGDLVIPNGAKVGAASTSSQELKEVHKATTAGVSGDNKNKYVVGTGDDTLAQLVYLINKNKEELILDNYPIPVIYLRVGGAKAHLEFRINPPSIGTQVEYIPTGGSGPLLSVSTSDHLKFDVNCTGAGAGYKIAKFQVIGRSDVYKELLVLAENKAAMHVFGDYEKGSTDPYYVAYNGRIGTFLQQSGTLSIKNLSTSAITTLSYGSNYTVVSGGNDECVIFAVSPTYMDTLAEGKYQFIVNAQDSGGQLPCSEVTAVVDNRATPSSNPDLSKGEMIFDKDAFAGYGSFIGTRTEKHAELPAIAKVMKIEATSVDVYYLDGNWDWQLLGSGYDVETSAPTASNADKYTKVILKKDFLNYISKGRNILRIDMTDGTQSVSYYVDLNIKEYVNPTPSPGKDESCEKVIGPTWHWNNDKGICEDVGVVGTSTR